MTTYEQAWTTPLQLEATNTTYKIRIHKTFVIDK